MESYSTSSFMEIYTRLLLHFGDPQWWPGETPFEVSVGAVLTQNTSWTNVEKAIIHLKELNLLEPEDLAKADTAQIASVIKPAGYFNQKAGYLRSLSTFISNEMDGDIGSLSSLSMENAREKLLSIRGVGKETADSILCYAVDMPVFVVDAYTKRIFRRLDPETHSKSWGPGGPGYEDVQKLVTYRIKGDVNLYNRFHALLVLLGKNKCRTKPECQGCPLVDICIIGSEHIDDNRQNQK